MQTKTILPTVSYELFSGRVSVKLFGQGSDYSDYAFRALRDKVTAPEDAAQTEDYKKIEAACFSHRVQTTGRHHVSRLFVPSTFDFNAIVGRPAQFTRKVQAAPDITAFRPRCERLPVFTSFEADGVVLEEPGDACWFSSADCPTLIVAGEDCVIAAHAGLKSLYRAHVNNGGSKDSIIDTIFKTLSPGVDFGRAIRAFVALGIGPENFLHRFDDPKYGKYNKDLVDFIYCVCSSGILRPIRFGPVWIAKFIEALICEKGVSAYHFGRDNLDTYSDIGASGRYVWWSHRRAVDKGTHDGRNGVLVVRNW